MRILFVCLGNICRSPTAAVVFEDLAARAGLADRFEVDSCGTGSHFAGHRSPTGTVAAARAAGLDLGRHRARGITTADYRDFDLLVAMDRSNLSDLRSARPPGAGRSEGPEMVLLLSYAPHLGLEDVPDPYMDEGSFRGVLEIIREGCQGLLDELVRSFSR